MVCVIYFVFSSGSILTIILYTCKVVLLFFFSFFSNHVLKFFLFFNNKNYFIAFYFKYFEYENQEEKNIPLVCEIRYFITNPPCFLFYDFFSGKSFFKTKSGIY